jgi:hypothetical protein
MKNKMVNYEIDLSDPPALTTQHSLPGGQLRIDLGSHNSRLGNCHMVPLEPCVKMRLLTTS